MDSSMISWLRSLQLADRLYLLAAMLLVVGLGAAGSMISWLRSLQLVDGLYFLAFMILVVGLGSVLISGNLSYFSYGAMPLACLAYIIGFGVWIWPWIRRIWPTPSGRFARRLMHGGILLLSIIPARILVAKVLGLPPQDFNVTVAISAVMFYLAFWVFIVEFLALCLSMIFMISFFGIMVSTYPLINPVILLFVKLFPEESPTRLFIEQKRSKFVWKSLGRFMGAFVFAAIAAIVLVQYQSVVQSFELPIRVIAYFADYQNVSRYPGVDANRRLRLHANGVVSYAEEDGWDIRISTEKIRPIQSSD